MASPDPTSLAGLTLEFSDEESLNWEEWMQRLSTKGKPFERGFAVEEDGHEKMRNNAMKYKANKNPTAGRGSSTANESNGMALRPKSPKNPPSTNKKSEQRTKCI